MYGLQTSHVGQLTHVITACVIAMSTSSDQCHEEMVSFLLPCVLALLVKVTGCLCLLSYRS